jgi:hypothetical protein
MYHRKIDPGEEQEIFESYDESATSPWNVFMSMYDNSSLVQDKNIEFKAPVDEKNVRTALPVVFIHGLGIGFAHYIYLLAR